MKAQISEKVEQLLQKGVTIPNPWAVEIGDAVDPDRIAGDGVVLYSGTKIFGAKTFIAPGARLGYEAPVTVENCQIGPRVELRGGFFQEAVFLHKAKMGVGAQVRAGTILEEEASGAHTVGLKQTILFPFVTLGSLINFCDCLMAGGTSRQNHSEVGSSYIHFNYTPNQDKATPSLIGNVPEGVMLRERPVFLGGQGGLVGPCRLAFGTVIAAGTIWRKDELRPNRLLSEGGRSADLPFVPGRYRGIRRILKNNILYIANLIALGRWYQYVRAPFVGEHLPAPLYEGLNRKLEMAVAERLKRLGGLCENHGGDLAKKWPALARIFHDFRGTAGEAGFRDGFLAALETAIAEHGKNYVPVIQSLSLDQGRQGSLWLQGIVNRLHEACFGLLESDKAGQKDAPNG